MAKKCGGPIQRILLKRIHHPLHGQARGLRHTAQSWNHVHSVESDPPWNRSESRSYNGVGQLRGLYAADISQASIEHIDKGAM